jgi:hypothetical protein
MDIPTAFETASHDRFEQPVRPGPHAPLGSRARPDHNGSTGQPRTSAPRPIASSPADRQSSRRSFRRRTHISLDGQDSDHDSWNTSRRSRAPGSLLGALIGRQRQRHVAPKRTKYCTSQYKPLAPPCPPPRGNRGIPHIRRNRRVTGNAQPKRIRVRAR